MMTSQRNRNHNRSLPGNDGSWFLEAIGAQLAEPAASPPSAADADTEPAPAAAPAADSSSEAAAPPVEAAASSVEAAAPSAGHPATTADRYRSELAAPVTEDPLADFTPQQLDRRLDSNRSWQWPFIILGGVVAVAIVFVILWLPDASQRRAADATTDLGDSLEAILEDLAPAQQALATLTDPNADISSLGALVAPITDLRADADTAVRRSAEPLPAPLPFASDEPFAELPALQNSAAGFGTSADAIARRLADLLDYRSTFDSFLDTGPLPATAAGADLDELASTLTTAAVDGATILSMLPSDAAFAEHRSAAEDVLVEFGDDQLGYIDALRTGDEGTAAAFVEALAEDRETLQRLMAETLQRLRTEIDTELVALSSAIAAELQSLSIPPPS